MQNIQIYSSDLLRDNEELLICTILGIFGSIIAYYIIPTFYEMLIKSHLYGIDMGKVQVDSKNPVKTPESAGIIIGMIYLILLTIFIPIEYKILSPDLIKYLGGLLAICWMLLLGFIDDVLNLKWRHKVWIPTVASLPLLVVYYMNINRTVVVLPFKIATINLGIFYYIYMGMLAVFCTNSINIYAGINGLEVGQSLIISLSVIVFNFIELENEKYSSCMKFSLHFMLPFFFLSLVLYYYNKYPAKVFVGDTYCYFAGMTFAVVGILAHMSKTLLLFFLPQILNFLLSVPQLFKIINCPRHRLPKFNKITKLRENSYTDKFKIKNIYFEKILELLAFFKIIKIEKEAENLIKITNLTLINVAINYVGPISEKKLTCVLILFQVFCSLVAFFIRYKLASYCY